MAVTTQVIPAAELVSRAADAPLIVANNLLQAAYKLGAANLVTNKLGTIAAGDLSASTFDRRKLTQRFKHKLWKGNSSGTAWYIVIDTGGVANADEWVDSVIVGPGHNLAGVNMTVKADSAATPPDAAWAAATTVFASAALAAGVNVRLHATVMTKARWWRIDLTSGGAFTPEATSFWLGKAMQFPEPPLLVSDAPNSYVADFIEVETAGGIPYRYKKHGALVEREVAWLIKEHHKGNFFGPATAAVGIDLDTVFRNVAYLDGGMRNFWWVDEPTTAPSTSAILARMLEAKFMPKLKRRDASAVTGLSAFATAFKEIGN